MEFAEQLREQGLSIVEAAIEAARIRLRPILMTSFAFILGVVPLVFAQGAGRAGRISVGTTVFGGNDCGNDAELAVYSGVVCDGEEFGAKPENASRGGGRACGLSWARVVGSE